MKDFSVKTRSALARKGIFVVKAIFSLDLGETIYGLDDNGTFRIRRFEEVIALAQ